MTHVSQQFVHDGITAYRNGHYNAAIDHLSSARTHIKRSGTSSTKECAHYHTLLRLYWLKTLIKNGVKTRSRRRLVSAIMRSARIGSGYRRRAIAIYQFGRNYNMQDDRKNIDRDLRSLAS